MSEKLEVTNSSFKELNTETGENLQGEGGKVKMLKKNKFIPLSPNINDTKYSIENKENDSFNINSYNMINNIMSIVEKNISPFKEEPQVVPEFEKYTWPLPGEILKNCKHPDKQISLEQAGNSSPVSNSSGHSYAEVLKSNISFNSMPNCNIEVNHCLHNDKEENCKLDEEINYLIDDYKNPFGVIGSNVVDKEESKKLSECQRRYSCNLNEENAFFNDEFSDISFKIDISVVEKESMTYLDEETKGLTISENCFRNELLDANNLRQEYSDITNKLDTVGFDVIIKETDRSLLGHIPKLLDSCETYTNQCVKTNALEDTIDFLYPLNINWNGYSSYWNCTETLRKDISSSIKNTRTNLSPDHECSFTSEVEVIPIEHVGVSSNSSVFLSNTLRVCGKKFKSERPVLFIPLQRSLPQDVEGQETNLIASPTHIAIESELSELWKEKSQKSFDKNSKNVSNPEGQEPSYENKLNDQSTMEDSEVCKEVQRFLNGSAEVTASSMSNSAAVITSFSSSILMTGKGFDYNNVTDHPSNAGAQIINDPLSVAIYNLKSILNEASNILLDYNSSYDFYKSVRNEVLQEIKEMDQRICKL